MRNLLVLVAFILLTNASFAQSFYAIRKVRALILSAGLGTSTYLGELANNGDYLDAKPTLNIGLQYYFTSRISARAEFNWFTLEGSDVKSGDAGRINRNLSFKSSNFEFSTIGMVNLYANGNRYYRRPMYNVYGFAGFGVAYFNPKADYQGKTYVLQPLQTEGVSYSRVTPVIPFGLGIRLKMGPNMNISFEGGYRKTFTDYMDDVSTVYPATYSSADAELLSIRGASYAVPGYKRGNPDSNDGYILFNAKLEYYLPLDFGGQNSGRTYSKKRSSYYRYNKKGGVRRK